MFCLVSVYLIYKKHLRDVGGDEGEQVSATYENDANLVDALEFSLW